MKYDPTWITLPIHAFLDAFSALLNEINSSHSQRCVSGMCSLSRLIFPGAQEIIQWVLF